MKSQIGLIIVVAIVGFFFSPIYFLNRKIRRFADEDLRNIDRSEWLNQLKWNAYSKFASRIIWGLILLATFFYRLNYMNDNQFDAFQVLGLCLGIGFIGFSLLGLRRDRANIAKNK